MARIVASLFASDRATACRPPGVTAARWLVSCSMSSSSVVARSRQDGPERRRRARATMAAMTTIAASTQGHHSVPSASSAWARLLVGVVSGGEVSSGGAVSGGAVSGGGLRRCGLRWRRAGVRWARRQNNRCIRWERRCDRRASTAAVTRLTRGEQHDHRTGEQQAKSHTATVRGARNAPSDSGASVGNESGMYTRASTSGRPTAAFAIPHLAWACPTRGD